MQTPSGKVYLVGAGPGDPGLLTRRAEELLQTCDVIAFDALISPAVLALCPSGKELIHVGYRGYGSSKLGHRLHPAIKEAALLGKNIVRLKSGDPSIFGRLTQECEELLELGISFEIVPGITSALAATAYAGFPLTDRDSSSEIILTSGHDLYNESPSHANWTAIAQSRGTLALYMAGSKVRENCRRLIDFGRDSETPAAFIANATRGNQEIVVGTLATLGELVPSKGKSAPALIVVGEVVSLRKKFSWRETQALHGLTALLVRARTGPSRIARLLRDQGADVIEAPWIEATSRSISILDSALPEMKVGEQLLFSCEDGVRFFFQRLTELGHDARWLARLRSPILAMGEGVRKALSARAIHADVVIDGHCEEALTAAAQHLRAKTVWVISSTREREYLAQALGRIGAEAKWLRLYDLEFRFPPIEAPKVDVVILPSSTSAKTLREGSWSEKMLNVPVVTLGPAARDEALSLGFTNVKATETDRPESLVEFLHGGFK